MEEATGNNRHADKLKIAMLFGPVAAQAVLDADSEALESSGLP